MPIMSEDEAQRRIDAIRAGWAEGKSAAQIARGLGVVPASLRRWINDYAIPKGLISRGEEPVAIPDPIEEVAPRELHDVAFYRKKATALERERNEMAMLIEELGSLREIETVPPYWERAQPVTGGRSVLILNTSDIHMGEVITPEEIEGINEFNPEVCAARMKRLFQAACEIGPRWMHGDTCDGVLLTMNGDLVSGDIHEELMRTNALTSTEQVRAVVEVYAAGIAMLLEAFPAVHVVATPGNHGRLTTKPTAKLSARLSYDIMAAGILQDRLAGDGRVTFQIAAGADARVPLYGRTILVTHGDRMGTGGGQGFAGPILPIVRGGNKIKLQSFSAGLGCDLILSGHYHTSGAPPGMLANGSIPGYSEYGNGLRAAVEPPKQWLARFSMKWGLCERLDVQLDDPGKPRVKAKSRWVA